MSSWCTIESDPSVRRCQPLRRDPFPQVFTELVETLGVQGVEFTELYGLDDADLANAAPVYGLIFLFKWTGEKDERAWLPEAPPGLFFAKQMVQNACATQAILSVLLNASANSPQVALGETLSELRSFSAELPYDMRGLAIENSEAIRTAHNSFARPEAFVSTEVAAAKDDDVFHFVAYVPFEGRVYELDGLKPGPIDLGDCGDSWLATARDAISTRIEAYAASEIKFNLMAVVRDRRAIIDERIAAAQSDDELASLQDDMALEVAKRQSWASENVRRRHNYVPLIVDMLKVLAEKGKLQGLIDAATEKAQAARSTSGKKTANA